MWILFIAVFYALPFIFMYITIRKDCINEGTSVGFAEVLVVVIPILNILVSLYTLSEMVSVKKFKSNLPNKFFRLKK
jgi:hypothetical protein